MVDLSINVSNIIAAAAFIVSIFSILFTVIHNSIIRKSLHEDTYQGFIGTWFDLGRIFIEHPNLRPYFYDNKKISEDDPDYQRVMAIAVFFDDCFTYTESQAATIPEDLKDSYEKYREKIKEMDAYKKFKNEYDWINNSAGS